MMKTITIQINENTSKEKLLIQFAKKLNFPYYFGMNYDALKDCLVDLSWLDKSTIIIKIIGITRYKDKKILLDILKEAKLFWEKGHERDFDFVIG